ncbi:MAG TPA: C1 family peptidase [Bacteriovoracaceae bacterium]|nr:C1 family peptidase [Bacteriovoracaceae bacterium]
MKFLKSCTIPNVVYAPYQTQGELRNILVDMGLSDLNWAADPTANRTTQAEIDALEYNNAHIPLMARQLAVYGINSYVIHNTAEAKDTSRIENYLKAGKEVVLGIDLKWRSHPSRAKTRIYDSTKSGAHMMLVVGFDKFDSTGPYFLVKNSWGDGVIRVHYDIIRNQTSMGIAVIESVRDTALANPSRWIGRWEMKHDRWRGQLFIRRLYEASLNRLSGYLRLGEYHHENGKKHCVYGTLDSTTKKLMLKINFDQSIENKTYTIKFDPDKPAVNASVKTVCPEMASGQYFELNMATNSHRQAYGRAVWNNVDFPAEIWRD